MKLSLFEEFIREEKLTPELRFIEFGRGNNRTLMFWEIKLYQNGKIIAYVDRAAGLEMGMLQVMIDHLEQKFTSLGYSDQKVSDELMGFVTRMVAA